jgi:hypothetical protein
VLTPIGSIRARRSISSPLALSSCKLWLRGDMGITSTPTKASAWADQSGAGNDWAQGTDAWRPVITASNANMGGVTTLAFTSAMIGLTRTNFAQGWTDATVAITYRRSVDTGAPRVFGVVSPSGGSFHLVNNSGSGFDASYINTGTNTRRSSPDGASTNFNRIAVIPIANAGADDPVVYTNGTAGGSVTSSTAANGTVPAASWNIGYLFDGDIAEVVAYDRLLSASEAALLAAYMIDWIT